MLYIFIGSFGLIVGSFLNVVIFRLYTKSSIIRDRSRCRQCRKVLKWYELIPVFSFIIQKGKCRSCNTKLSWQYPIVEIATALLFLQTASYKLQAVPKISPEFILGMVFLWIIVSGLLVIFVYDLKHSIIPDIVLVILFIVTALAFVFGILPLGEVSSFPTSLSFVEAGKFQVLNILNALFVGLLAMAPFAFLHFGSRGRWMGFGDVKLAFFMGFLLGLLQVIIALFVAFLSGAIIGLALILSKKKNLKSKISFGPFLIFGTYIAFFWGQEIAQWYLSLLLSQ